MRFDIKQLLWLTTFVACSAVCVRGLCALDLSTETAPLAPLFQYVIGAISAVHCLAGAVGEFNTDQK